MHLTNENELIEALTNGSYDAFSELYRMYIDRLYSFCFSITKDSALSKDIVQDTFIQLWNNHSNIRSTNSIKGLLFTIAKGRLINAYRSMVNSNLYKEYLIYNQTEVASTDQKLIYEDFLNRLNKSMNKLSSTQKNVIMMSKIEGMKIKEIAETLNLSEQTVKNQISIGMKSLRQMLKNTDFILLLLTFVNNQVK